MPHPRPLALTIASLLFFLPQASRAGMETSPPTSGVGGDLQGSKKIIEPPIENCMATGLITFAYQGSEGLNLGYMESVTPLWRPGNAEVFLDTRSALDDESRYSSSYGLGFRYLFPKQEIIVGANAFYDSIHSPYGNDFNQLGVGAEVMTKWVDARFNYYLPDGNLYEVGRSTSVTSSTDAGPLFLNGLLLQQELTTTQRIRTISFAEGAMQGWDAEIGFLVPGLDRYMQVRLFAGAYHFDNPVGPNFTGVKARLEARLLPGVTADVAYWEDAYLNGGKWTAGLRVSVPFSIGNIFTGRNPFEGFVDQFRPGQQQEFCKRMGEQVLRSPARTTATGWDPEGHINGARDGIGSSLRIKTTTETATLGKITAFQPANESGTPAAGTFSGGLFSVATTSGTTLLLATTTGGTISSGALSFSGGTLSISGATLTTTGGSILATNGVSLLRNADSPIVAQNAVTTNQGVISSLTLSNQSSGTVFTGASLSLSNNVSTNAGTLFLNPANSTLGTLTLSGVTVNTVFTGGTLNLNSGVLTAANVNIANFNNSTVNVTGTGTTRTILLQGQTFTVPPSGGTLVLTNGVVTGGTLFNP